MLTQKDQIIQLSQGLYPDVVAHRRHLHQHPELSFQEYETSAYIKKQLQNMEIAYEEVAGTGIVGIIKGEREKNIEKAVVLRADIDALPITEENELSFSSQNRGVMHACGHDFHTANLLGVAAVLQALKYSFSGKIILLFQPAEEKIPGGARAVLESGCLDRIGGNIVAVLGLHVSPRLSTGEIGVCPGRFMASSDEIYLKIKGRGGHAAEPNRAIDPVMVTAQLLNTLQQVVSRKADPSIPSVLTFGKILADGAANVIPDHVWLEGTFRTMDEDWRKQAHQQIRGIISKTAEMLGAEAELEIRNGYPVLINDPLLSQQFKLLMTACFGTASLKDVPQWMAAEDFAYYSHCYPSLFFLVGIKGPLRSIQYGLHNAKFDLDEQAFLHAMQAMSMGCLRFLDDENR